MQRSRSRPACVENVCRLHLAITKHGTRHQHKRSSMKLLEQRAVSRSLQRARQLLFYNSGLGCCIAGGVHHSAHRRVSRRRKMQRAGAEMRCIFLSLVVTHTHTHTHTLGIERERALKKRAAFMNIYKRREK
jgi:hypothetical protein